MLYQLSYSHRRLVLQGTIIASAAGVGALAKTDSELFVSAAGCVASLGLDGRGARPSTIVFATACLRPCTGSPWRGDGRSRADSWCR